AGHLHCTLSILAVPSTKSEPEAWPVPASPLCFQTAFPDRCVFRQGQAGSGRAFARPGFALDKNMAFAE
ncbi:hypothetical protein, partial [Rhodovulum sulfidophilum]|uniref:hypothetical protein n=1 Tax=Rhodovulum sulfidophilum TaxID=35806 RepID=UPI001F2B7E8A